MIAPIEPEPIKSWKDVLIRIGIPIAVITIILYSLLPIMIQSLIGDDDSKYGHTGKEGYRQECINNKWFYNHSIKECNELGVFN